MSIRIPLSVPTVGPAEQQAVADAVASGWVAPAGPHLARFEEDLARRTGRSRAVLVSSGTAALHLALLAVGIGAGDRVLCPTLTFVATANAIAYTGAEAVLVDCGEDGLLDPALVGEVLEQEARTGRPITALLPVDLYGRIADHDRFAQLAARHGAVLLVDAAESLGSTRAGLPAGSQGRAAAVSFNGNKIITASSGGAVLTDDDALADRVLHLSTQARRPVPHYLHHETGYNYRLSNVLAALGLAQLERLDEFMAVRRAHRERYRQLCEQVPGLGILGGPPAGGSEHHGADDSEDNCWLTVLRLPPDPAGEPGDALVDLLGRELAAHGIETRRLFTPLHTQPLFASTPAVPGALPGVAERLFDTTLTVPSSPASTPPEIDEVCTRIEQVLRAREEEAAA